MEFRRAEPLATTLADGTVFVTGDDASTPVIGATPLHVSERYDPETDQWQRSAFLSPARADHAQILLSNGTVMLVGTSKGNESTQRMVDILDPETSTTTGVDPVNECRRRKSRPTPRRSSRLGQRHDLSATRGISVPPRMQASRSP